MPRYLVDVEYQTESGDASSARYEVDAADDFKAQKLALARLGSDRRRRPGKIVSGTVEELK